MPAITSSLPWSNNSVKQLERAHGDPLIAVTKLARALTYEAIESGWVGPPFDPMFIARMVGLDVLANDDVVEARLVPTETSARIEFNPSRPAGRRRFSIAHEIAHTLFEDFREAVRNREPGVRAQSDDWQLEALCNVAAAEFLMPVGCFPSVGDAPLEIRSLLQLRSQFDVSLEALLLHVVKNVQRPVAVFAASRVDPTGENETIRIDYLVGSPGWTNELRSGAQLPDSPCLREITAVGWTAAGTEHWAPSAVPLMVQAAGIPPYPEHVFPRVVGILEYESAASTDLRIQYLLGDATEPRGSGARIIAHIVNNRAHRWGAGFAGALRRRHPSAEKDFTKQVTDSPGTLTLGNALVTQLDALLTVANLVGQEGYGKSKTARVRYASLEVALEQLRDLALELGASVHMPRIGTGQAGGDWRVIEGLINEKLISAGIQVTVYDLPGTVS